MVAAGLLLGAGGLRPLPAQDQALVLFVNVGRHAPLANLSDAGDDLSPGFSYGGGLALQFGPSVALRGSLGYHRGRYRGDALAVADSGFARLVWAGDLQVGWPATSSLVPYVYLGGAVVTTDLDDDALTNVTGGGGRLGVGLNRVGGLGAWFFEFGTIIHKFSGNGFDRVQLDLEARVGFALALGL
jgi:hypothetical protein